MNDKPSIKPAYIPPLKKICMTIGQLPSSYLETMSYYEMLVWFVEYLRNTIIPTIDNNSEAVQELQRLYEDLRVYVNTSIEDFEGVVNNKVQELEDYMNNYFDNLDVQEEINNKLDEMLEDGVLEQIIEQFLQSTAIWCFDTVSDMQNATNLTNGSYCKTLGYYTINDGGGATYKITNSTSNLYHQETIGESLYANLIVENDTINFRQLGAIPNDDTYDNHSYYVEFESLCNTNNKKLKLYIPSGVWYSSETQFTRVQGLQIIGNNKTMRGRDVANDNTVLKNINNSQDYYFKIGNNSNSTTIPFENLVMGYVLDGLIFEGSYNNSAIVILGCMYSKIGTLHFRFITKGHCLNISSSWEWDVDFMSFRVLSTHDSAIYFDNVYTIPGVASNCSAFYFNYLNFEGLNCSAIETNTKANFVNNEFNVIEYERSFATSGAVSSLPEVVTLDDTFKIYLFKGWFDKTTINSINHNNRGTIYVQDGETDDDWITYLALFSDDIINVIHTDYAYNNFHVSLSNLLLTGDGASYIVSSHNAERTSILTIGNVHQRDKGEQLYLGDGNNGLVLQIGNINNTTDISKQYALNCLMDKMLTNSKSTSTAYKGFELMTTSKALDISGCCLVSRFSQPIPCNGVKKINLTVSLIDKTTKEDVASTMRFGYKNRTDTSYTYITNTNITTGLNRITIDLSEINYPEQYVIYATSVSLYDLIVYTINYEY